MAKPPNMKEKLKELPFLILLVLITFVTVIFYNDMYIVNPAVDFDQWSEFVVWALGLWFAEQSIKRFTNQPKNTDETLNSTG